MLPARVKEAPPAPAPLDGPSPVHEPLGAPPVRFPRSAAFLHGDLRCAYRKLKLGRSGDEVRPGWHVT
jgi:hypothetical protein